MRHLNEKLIDKSIKKKKFFNKKKNQKKIKKLTLHNHSGRSTLWKKSNFVLLPVITEDSTKS